MIANCLVRLSLFCALGGQLGMIKAAMAAKTPTAANGTPVSDNPGQLYPLNDVPIKMQLAASVIRKGHMKPRFIWFKTTQAPETQVTLVSMACKDEPADWHVTAEWRTNKDKPRPNNFDPDVAAACKYYDPTVVAAACKDKENDPKKCQKATDSQDKVAYLMPSWPSQNRNPLVLGQGIVIAIYDKDDLIVGANSAYIGLNVQPTSMNPLVPAPLRQNPAPKQAKPGGEKYYFLAWNGNPVTGDVALNIKVSLYSPSKTAKVGAIKGNATPLANRDSILDAKEIPPPPVGWRPDVESAAFTEQDQVAESRDLAWNSAWAGTEGSAGDSSQPQFRWQPSVESAAVTEHDQIAKGRDLAWSSDWAGTGDSAKDSSQAGQVPIGGDANANPQQQPSSALNTTLPQTHNVSYYNIAAGLVGSTLRGPSWTRQEVAPAVSCPTGAPQPCVASPALYQTVENPKAARTVAPVLFFMIYPKPIDAERKWRPMDLIPGISLGLSLSSPATDYFGGLSFEVLRGVQVVAGRHIGKVNELVQPAINDPTSSAAPQTIQRFHPAWFIGVTFNFTFIQTLFKGGS